MANELTIEQIQKNLAAYKGEKGDEAQPSGEDPPYPECGPDTGLGIEAVVEDIPLYRYKKKAPTP